MTLKDSTRDKIESIFKQNPVVLFMKGTPKAPMCGFSSKTVGLLDSILDDYKSVDVLEDQDIREGIKAYGNWPTIPQLYIDGELVASTNVSPQTATPTQFYLGRWPGGAEFFTGFMDEMLYFNRDLTQTEVKNIYLMGRP